MGDERQGEGGGDDRDRRYCTANISVRHGELPRRKGEMVTIDLVASPRNAGETGKAFLLPSGDATQVRIDVSGSGVPVASPVQLYMFIYEGRCGSLGAQPKYTLTQVVQVSSALNPANLGGRPGPWTLSNRAPAPLAVLRGTPHALVVRTRPADGNVDLFCGNL